MVTVRMQSRIKHPLSIAISCTFSEVLPTIVSARFEFEDILDENGDPTTWTATPSAQTTTSIIASHVFAADGSETVAGTKYAIVVFTDGDGREYPSQRFAICFS